MLIAALLLFALILFFSGLGWTLHLIHNEESLVENSQAIDLV